MYITNNTCPKTEPFGTPHLIGRKFKYYFNYKSRNK